MLASISFALPTDCCGGIHRLGSSKAASIPSTKFVKATASVVAVSLVIGYAGVRITTGADFHRTTNLHQLTT